MSEKTVTVELTLEECDVAEDLRLAAAYGTEWDTVLESVAEKLENALKKGAE